MCHLDVSCGVATKGPCSASVLLSGRPASRPSHRLAGPSLASCKPSHTSPRAPLTVAALQLQAASNVRDPCEPNRPACSWTCFLGRLGVADLLYVSQSVERVHVSAWCVLQQPPKKLRRVKAQAVGHLLLAACALYDGCLS